MRTMRVLLVAMLAACAYRVAADSLAFAPEPAWQGGEMRFRYEPRGPALHLHDDDTFVFRRR